MKNEFAPTEEYALIYNTLFSVQLNPVKEFVLYLNPVTFVTNDYYSAYSRVDSYGISDWFANDVSHTPKINTNTLYNLYNQTQSQSNNLTHIRYLLLSFVRSTTGNGWLNVSDIYLYNITNSNNNTIPTLEMTYNQTCFNSTIGYLDVPLNIKANDPESDTIYYADAILRQSLDHYSDIITFKTTVLGVCAGDFSFFTNGKNYEGNNTVNPMDLFGLNELNAKVDPQCRGYLQIKDFAQSFYIKPSYDIGENSSAKIHYVPLTANVSNKITFYNSLGDAYYYIIVNNTNGNETVKDSFGQTIFNEAFAITNNGYMNNDFMMLWFNDSYMYVCRFFGGCTSTSYAFSNSNIASYKVTSYEDTENNLYSAIIYTAFFYKPNVLQPNWSTNLPQLRLTNSEQGSYRYYITDSVHKDINQYNYFDLNYYVPNCDPSLMGNISICIGDNCNTNVCVGDDCDINKVDGTENLTGLLTVFKNVGNAFCETGNQINALAPRTGFSYDMCAIMSWFAWGCALVFAFIVGAFIGQMLQNASFTLPIGSFFHLFFVWIVSKLVELSVTQVILSGFIFTFGVISFIYLMYGSGGVSGNGGVSE